MKKQLVITGILCVVLFTACGTNKAESSLQSSGQTEVFSQNTAVSSSRGLTPFVPVVEGVLSDSIFSYQLEIEGALYALPVDLAVFVQNGWETTAEITKNLEPDEKMSIRMQKGTSEIKVFLGNFGVARTAAEACVAYGVEVFANFEDKPAAKMRLPAALTFGANKADVEAAYGAANQIVNFDTGIIMQYGEGGHTSIELTLKNDPAQLHSAIITRVP